MKTALLIAAVSLFILATLFLSACSTAPDGSKTFLALNGKEWATVGRDAGQAAAKAAVVSYGTRRAVTAAKNPVLVNP